MIRVTRILTYVYRDQAVYQEDQAHWQAGISRTWRPNGRVTIRSATLPAEVIEDVEGPPKFGKPDPETLAQMLGVDPRSDRVQNVMNLFGYEHETNSAPY